MTGSTAPDSARSSSRAALLAAALDEFSTKGYEAATVADIAERAGVTTGALYAHFRGKLDLLLATIGLQTVDDLLVAVEAVSRHSWEEAREMLGGSFAGRVDERTLLLLDVIVVARRDPRVAATLRSGLREYVDGIVQFARAGRAARTIDPPLEEHDLAHVTVALALGFIVLHALDEEPPGEEAFLQLTELLLAPLRSSDRAVGGTDPLAVVRARASHADDARRELERAMLDALDSGESLRAVGAAAGLSHERVRQLLASARDSST